MPGAGIYISNLTMTSFKLRSFLPGISIKMTLKSVSLNEENLAAMKRRKTPSANNHLQLIFIWASAQQDWGGLLYGLFYTNFAIPRQVSCIQKKEAPRLKTVNLLGHAGGWSGLDLTLKHCRTCVLNLVPAWVILMGRNRDPSTASTGPDRR